MTSFYVTIVNKTYLEASWNRQAGRQAVRPTGCLKKLFPLCVLSISKLPLLLKIEYISVLKSPFIGQFKNVQNFISR